MIFILYLFAETTTTITILPEGFKAELQSQLIRDRAAAAMDIDLSTLSAKERAAMQERLLPQATVLLKGTPAQFEAQLAIDTKAAELILELRENKATRTTSLTRTSSTRTTTAISSSNKPVARVMPEISKLTPSHLTK